MTFKLVTVRIVKGSLKGPNNLRDWESFNCKNERQAVLDLNSKLGNF